MGFFAGLATTILPISSQGYTSTRANAFEKIKSEIKSFLKEGLIGFLRPKLLLKITLL